MVVGFLVAVAGLWVAAAAAATGSSTGCRTNSNVYSSSFQVQVAVPALQYHYLYYRSTDPAAGFFIYANASLTNVDLFISRASDSHLPDSTHFEYTTAGRSNNGIRIPFNESTSQDCYVIGVRTSALATIPVDVKLVSIPENQSIDCEALTGAPGFSGVVDEMDSASGESITYVYYNAVAGSNFTIVASPNDDSVDVLQMFVSRASFILEPNSREFEMKSTFQSGLQLVAVSPLHSECYAIGFVSESVAYFNLKISETVPENAVCAYRFGAEIPGQIFGTPTLTSDIDQGSYQYYYYSASPHRKIDITILPGSDFVEVSVDKAENSLKPRFFSAEVSSYYTGSSVSFSSGSVPVCYAIAVYGKELSRYTLEFSTSELRGESSKTKWPPIYGVWIAFAFVAGVTATASCFCFKKRSLRNCAAPLSSETLGYTQAPTSDAEIDAALMSTDETDAGQIKLRTSDHY